MAPTGAFARWIGHQDLAVVGAGSSFSAWVGTSAIVATIIALGAFVPFTSGFFELRWQGALVAYTPVLANALWFRRLNPEQGLSRTAALLLVTGSALIQFYCASLVAFSGERAAPIFGALTVATAGIHGHIHRVTYREPFGALGTMLAILAVFPLSPSAAHTQILLLVLPCALFLTLFMGTLALQHHRADLEQLNYRTAISAQTLREQVQQYEALQATYEQLIGRNHDLNNALTAVVLHSRALKYASANPELSTPEDLGALTGELAEAVDRLSAIAKSTLSKVRSPEAPSVEPLDVVEARRVLEHVVTDARRAYPGTQIHLECPGDLRVRAREGETSIARVLLNLLLNACQGTGDRRAGAVTVRVERLDDAARVRITVTDDGPGFPADLIAGRVEAFRTTKPDGTGLGLYTADQLVRASGGRLERANRPQGGAVVTVELPAG